MKQNVHVRVRFEDQAFWATVEEYPGVFAAGDTLEELRESLEEGLSLVIRRAGAEEPLVRLSPLALTPAAETLVRSELSIA